MRTTKVPGGEAPPLVQKSVFSPRDETSGGAAAVAAKLSLCGGLFAFLINVYAASQKVHLSRNARIGVLVVCGVLIVGGLGLAGWSLWANRRARRSGVTAFAVTSIVVNAFQIALHVHAYFAARAAADGTP